MLTRALLQSGSFLRHLDALPAHLRWTPGRIADSMASTLHCGPATGDVWLFGYGSLIWNPIIRYAEREPAVLDGWHRSFCMRLIAGRASIPSPGRMLGLLPGGHTGGVVYRLPAATLEEELSLVWTREMATGAYKPMWLSVTLPDGTRMPSIVFVSTEDHPFLETDTSVATIAPLIATASGPIGTNADYVFRLAAAIEQLELEDSYIETLAVELSRIATLPG